MTMQPDLDITFLDHLRPKATAGTYKVVVDQALKKSGGGSLDPSNAAISTEKAFEIRAPQFVLDRGSLHAFYPAPGASGDFTRVLPHITLSRAPLPWEREQRWSRASRRAPWLALLVFREGELPDDPEALGEGVQRSVPDLVTPGDRILGPELTDLPETALAGKCTTIDVPVALFSALVPREEEMYYLAHGRKVTEPRLLADGEMFTKGEFSVLTANRFPRDAGNYAVHLVSFEGFNGRLGPTPPPGYDHVRLASLWSWSFRCDTDAAFDAKAILENLVAPGSEKAEKLELRLVPEAATPPAPDAAQRVALERLRLGYVPVPHRVLSGERTYAWYRGPLTPVTAPPVPGGGQGGGHTTADHALIYDQEHGLFDVSYATAWTLGRTIALADPQYATEATHARRELANTAARFMARSADPVRCAAALDDPDDGRNLRALRELARDRGGRTLVDALTAPLRTPDPQLRTAAARRPRMSRADARAALAGERAQAVLSTVAARNTGTMPGWLDRLGLLRGVPFPYLVPDARMLPPESLRFFRIDEAWIDALVDGANSVGLHTSMDRRLAPLLRQATAAHRSPSSKPRAGLLIRSALVPAWPEIRIFATDKDGNALTELRRDHPDQDVLLCLFDGVPDHVVLREPGQGIHFGIDAGDQINLRQLKENAQPPLGASLTGKDFPPRTSEDTVFSAYLRRNGEDGPNGVLHLLDGEGRPGLVRSLAQAPGIDLDDLHPAQLAVQFVNAPLEQHLTVLGHQP
ncbi:hypothetical protein EKH77_26905 [Streptomyces luteoverticillatus]|uniref:Uncharacterized protein n=1 Tax=Streptomyces luteoverticillatus TaxID=66425 RepID=A0A3S9PPM9_STRLT|nr:hypothetical protein [Streptomyces luteoverticillatus]AZQ74356.1 hypothetical protein EKH77_26905 [Streptomyces luteoverticillatus]